MSPAAGNDRQKSAPSGLSGLGASVRNVVASAERPRVRSALSLAFPSIALVAVCGFIGYLAARQIDDREQERQREQLVTALADIRASLADATTRLARDSAERRVAFAPTEFSELAARDAGSSRPGYNAAYLIAEGRTLASFPPRTAAPAALMMTLGEFRNMAVDRKVAGPTAAMTDLVLIGDRPSLIAIAGTEADAATGVAVVVTALPLDAQVARLLQRNSGVDALAIAAEHAGSRHPPLSLLDTHGRVVGWLNWEPRRLGMAMLQRMLPLAALAIAGLMAWAGLVIYRLRHGTADAGDSSDPNIDALTQVANRTHTFVILDRALAARAPGQTVMLALLELDKFQDVNDSFGYRGGDVVLAAVAQRLQEMVPATAMVGRVGGDEFAIVMTADNPVFTIETANAAITALTAPIHIGTQNAFIGGCIGLAQAPRDGEIREEIVRRADLALRTARRRGRGSIVEFELVFEQEFHDRRFLMRGLRRALAEDGLDMHYQPIVAAGSGRVVGVEALLRWRHRTRGEIPPEVFVPIAEQSGLMNELGEFALRRALADAARWKNLYVGINLSPLQVREPGLVDLVATLLRQTGTPPARVVLEVTEGVLIDEPEKAIKRLDKLRALGVKIALDDFGAGYSSLRYLQRFPIDKLKIDKGFVASLSESEHDGVIIQAIIGLGRALGLGVLAEGIETEEQRVLMRIAGCDEMQGHLFGRPQPAAEIDLLNLALAPKVNAA